MTDWLSTAARINDFTLEDASLDAWQRWFQDFIVVLDQVQDSKRVAVLMIKCKGFQPVWKLLGVDADVTEYDEFIFKMNQYLNPTYARRVLSMRKQGEDETFESFANDLEALSRPCRYTDDKILRDFFVINMHPSHAQVVDAICQRYDISFEEAVSTAKSMVYQGRFPQEMRSSRSLNGSCTPRPPSSSWKDSGNVNIRMVPIIPGTHEVKVLNSQPPSICHVFPTGMVGARNDFFDFLNKRMKNCKGPAVTPTKGARYAALIKCSWYRVDVLSVKELQKTAIVAATDFGWTWTVPFSVFQNLPLDFRPPPPLLWIVTFRTPMHQVEEGKILMVDIAYVKETWVASTVPGMNSDQQPFVPNGDSSGSSSISSQILPSNKPFGYHKPRGAASDSDSDRADGVQNTQLRGRTRGQHMHGGRNKSPTGRNRSHSRGRVLKQAHAGSSTESSKKNLTSVDSRTRIGRQSVDRESFLDNQSEGRPRYSKNNNFNRGHFNGRQHSGHPAAHTPSSAGKLVESDGYANIRSNHGSNAQHQRLFYPESTSTSVDNHLDRSANGNFKRQENSSNLSTAKNSLESNSRRHNSSVTCGINGNVDERQLAFSRQPLTERQVPLGRFIKVQSVERSPDGKILYCILESLMKECAEMTNKLTTLEGLEPLEDPQKGALCLATDAEALLYRAEITRIHPSGQKVKVRFLDFGNEETRKVSELLVLPDEYTRIQPYAFPVEVPSDLEVDPVQDLEVMAISRDEGSAWKAKIRIDGVEVSSPAAAPPVGQLARKSSARSISAPSPPPRPLHPPPIPRNTFTSITIVHVGTEGAFAVDSSKISCLGDVHAEINRIDLAPLAGVPKVNQLCVAPFQEELFRARILEVQPNKCIVVFVDFGNEAVISVRDLKRLPEELSDNIITFKISLDPRSEVVLKEMMSLEATPVTYGADGSWLVQLQGEPSPGPDHSLPDDDVL